jgi:Molybdopterin-binding domain of aldehyde dehydrogenase
LSGAIGFLAVLPITKPPDRLAPTAPEVPSTIAGGSPFGLSPVDVAGAAGMSGGRRCGRGGFGRRPKTDYVTQAVLIAKQLPGTPIKMIWSREEDMLRGAYHPVTQARMVGAFDAANNLIGLRMRISGQSILASVLPARLDNGRDPLTFQGLNPKGDTAFGYAIPNLLIDHSMRNPPVPPGFGAG